MENNMNDLISIVSTLYNYKKYVGDMIESVLKQTYINWELIIVDDCSLDNPYEIISRYKDDRIKYIKLERNMGYSYAKNHGIIKSMGKYITMIDSDDMLTEKSLEIRYNALKKSKKLWCHGDAKDLNVDGKISIKGNQKRKKRRKDLTKKMDLTREYSHGLIHAQTVMVKRKFHFILGLYDESLRFSSDNEMFRRAIKFQIIPDYCEDFVAIYRRHDEQMSRSSYKKKNLLKIKEKIIKDVNERYENGISEKNTRLLLE